MCENLYRRGEGVEPPPPHVCVFPPPCQVPRECIVCCCLALISMVNLSPGGPVVGSKDDRKLPLSPQKYSTVPSLSRDLLLFKTCILYFWMIKCRLAVNKVTDDHEGTRWWQMPLQFRRLYVLSYYTVLHFERI